jgi:hypothetical protein
MGSPWDATAKVLSRLLYRNLWYMVYEQSWRLTQLEPHERAETHRYVDRSYSVLPSAEEQKLVPRMLVLIVYATGFLMET